MVASVGRSRLTDAAGLTGPTGPPSVGETQELGPHVCLRNTTHLSLLSGICHRVRVMGDFLFVTL